VLPYFFGGIGERRNSQNAKDHVTVSGLDQTINIEHEPKIARRRDAQKRDSRGSEKDPEIDDQLAKRPKRR